ncbi:MAG: hypothetical protein ACREOJ_10520 [Gemmatimonadaceae bacterium]
MAAESEAAAAVAAAAASPYDALAAAFKERDAALSRRLLRFARARYGAEWPTDVLYHECVLHYDELCDIDSPFLIPWMEHCWVGTTGLTLAQEWQRHERESMSDDDQIILDAYEKAWVSLWEVNAVRPGTGLRLVDLLTGEERFMRDICDSRDMRSAEPLQLFDSVLAIVIDCGGMSLFGGVHGQALSPCWAKFATDEARSMFRVGWIDEYELTAPYDEVVRCLAALPGMLRFRVRRDGTMEWLLAHGREPDSSASPPHP